MLKTKSSTFFIYQIFYSGFVRSHSDVASFSPATIPTQPEQEWDWEAQSKFHPLKPDSRWQRFYDFWRNSTEAKEFIENQRAPYVLPLACNSNGLLLPPGMANPHQDLLHQNVGSCGVVFVRRVYEELFERVHRMWEHPARRMGRSGALVTGQPDTGAQTQILDRKTYVTQRHRLFSFSAYIRTGKTTWLFYVLVRLICDNQVVVLYTRHDKRLYIFWKDGKVYSGKDYALLPKPFRGQRKRWTLIDGEADGLDASPDLLSLYYDERSFPVECSFPSRQLYNIWVRKKRIGCTLGMPLWTRDELDAWYVHNFLGAECAGILIYIYVAW